jgi:hypothetical protein
VTSDPVWTEYRSEGISTFVGERETPIPRSLYGLLKREKQRRDKAKGRLLETSVKGIPEVGALETESVVQEVSSSVGRSTHISLQFDPAIICFNLLPRFTYCCN